ncbi:MAG: PrgI family protein [Candidatus Liptonbacteria bacterium]|nr:PrgI family protein [Candidatus Liptonbacteria bacterium]
MQYQVPQFIEVEDKIAGPFTIRQFLYLAGSGVVSFVFYFTVQTWLWALCSIAVVGISLGLGFITINGQSLPKIIAAAFSFFWEPQRYIWQSTEKALPQGSQPPKPVTPGFDLERVLAGLALKTIWQEVQTGRPSAPPESPQTPTDTTPEVRERFQIIKRPTGEHRAARRIDYR